MKLLLLFVSVLSCSIPAFGQAPKDKKPEAKKPAEVLIGLWHGKTAGGDEYMTFTADGRVIMQRGAAESMTMKYTLNTTTAPWQMDMSGVVQGVDVTIFTVFDFPNADQFHMAPMSPDKDKRPDGNQLKESKLIMNRVTLAANEGIYQVVETYRKKLAGTWEAKQGSATITLTLTADGAYSMSVPDMADKGRFSFNVAKSPLTIDFLSTEGAAIKYSLFGLTKEGDLRIGGFGNSPETRPKALEDGGGLTLKRKSEAAKGK